MSIWSSKILIIGAGERGTAASVRLFNAGFRPIIIELKNPTDLHYKNTFADVVYSGRKICEGITAVIIESNIDIQNSAEKEIHFAQMNNTIPVLTSELNELIKIYNPQIMIDCSGIFPQRIKLDLQLIPFVIQTNVPSTIGEDGHVILHSAGEFAGKIIRHDESIKDHFNKNSFIINSPLEGVFISNREPGAKIKKAEIIGTINGINILAPEDGILSGILHSGHFIHFRQPLCEITPATTFLQSSQILTPRVLLLSGTILEVILGYLYSRQLS